MENKIKKLQELIDNAKKIVFFGGAGVSTESGIKDFRSKDGLYSLKSKFDVTYEVMLSHSYFENNIDSFPKYSELIFFPFTIRLVFSRQA